MKVKILDSTDDHMFVGWEDESGFGTLRIMYETKGRYTVDAEYISMEKVINIIKAVAELEGKQVIELENDDQSRK